MACASVISRTAAVPVSLRVALGIDMLIYLACLGERGVEPELHPCLNFGLGLRLHLRQPLGVRDALCDEPLAQQCDRVALCAPELLLLLGAVVGALDVADVAAVVSIRVAQEERWPLAAARSRHQRARRGIDGAHILPVYPLAQDAERLRPRAKIAGGGFCIGRVLVVEIVLADVDDGELPE